MVFGRFEVFFSISEQAGSENRGAGKASSKIEILIAQCIKVRGQRLLEHGFPHTAVQLAAGIFHIRVSCILLLGRISFIVLLSAQLCCVAVL